MGKKILILSKYFYPIISPRSFRTTELAKELARQGHNVTVCFPARGYDYRVFALENNLVIKDLGEPRWKSIALRGGKPELLLRRFIRRSMQMLFEYPDIELYFMFSEYLKKENNYDLLVSIAVPHTIHWGVAIARNKDHRIAKTWIADCGDPYMGCQTDSFRKLFYFKYFEKWFCRKADFISVPAERSIEGYYKEFHNKIRVIPQGFSFANCDLPAFKKNRETIVFAYSGGFIPGKRDPRKFLDFLSGLNRDFEFIVYTNQQGLVEGYKKTLGGKLMIRDYIPRSELLKELSRVDFLVNFDNNTDYQVPSKLIDYALTGRPVLNIKDEFDPSIFMQFISEDYSGRMVLTDIDQYNIRNVAKKFLDLSC